MIACVQYSAAIDAGPMATARAPVVECVMGVNFSLAAQVMQSIWGAEHSESVSPAPRAAFALLREVDALFTALQAAAPEVENVRFRFTPAAGLPQLELDVHRRGTPSTSWIGRCGLGKPAEPLIRKTLERANAVIAPLRGDDRTNALSLAFGKTFDQPVGMTWYGCRPEDMENRVALVLTPYGCRMLQAMEESLDMKTRTDDVPAHPPPPKSRF